MQNTEALKNYLSQIGCELADEKIACLLSFCDRVLEANKSFNLTAITDYNDFLIKHVTDSLLGASEIPQNALVCDIGSGAGFPAMPLAIAREDITVTALDSTAKKMTFVSESARSLGIKNLKTVAGRAEDQKKQFCSFDVVTARAVSSLPILLELAMPLLKVGGLAVFYKTDESELAGVSNALKTLKAAHIGTKLAALPNGDKRAILTFKKLAPTPPQYPRQYGTIKKKPL